MNGQACTNFLQTDAVGASGYALFVRNFFVLPMLLFLATASSVAGERANGTLRELVVRPVPRWSILAAKTVALWALSIFTLVGTFLASILLGWAIFAEPAAGAAAGSVVRVFLGYAASFVSDVALIALGLALATFMRSVGGVVVSLLLLLMVDRFVWVMLYGLPSSWARVGLRPRWTGPSWARWVAGNPGKRSSNPSSLWLWWRSPPSPRRSPSSASGMPMSPDPAAFIHALGLPAAWVDASGCIACSNEAFTAWAPDCADARLDTRADGAWLLSAGRTPLRVRAERLVCQGDDEVQTAHTARGATLPLF